MKYKHREDLINNKKRLGMWGLGYIGFSSIAYFGQEGIHGIGTDIDESKVKHVNKGKTEIPNLERWLGFDIKPLAETGIIQATKDWKELISNEVNTHFICVPTEKHDEPYDEALIDVIKKLANYKDTETDYPPLVIIESTLTPDKVDNLILPFFEEEGFEVGEDILLGVAPRRDWFTSPDKTLKTLPRVIGGTTPETTDTMAEVLGIVCQNLLKATDHKHAAMVKSVENAYRAVEIQLANELSLAYPDINITEVLKFAGTKWNIGTYHPSIGIGGYCIPLAPKYLKEGARNPNKLEIFDTTIDSFERQPIIVARNLVERSYKKIGVLGIAYKGDLKVHTMSPAIDLIEELKNNQVEVKAQDPYYEEDEIKEIAGVDTFSYPEGLSEFDAIVIAASHTLYQSTPRDQVIENLENCKLIIDNMGVWSKIPFEERGIEYHEVGDRNWISSGLEC